MTIIIVINVKGFLKRHYFGYFNKQFLKINLLLWKKLYLLIAKLTAYGFDYQSLRIMESFLPIRQQRTKINNAFSRYSEIKYGVPQGSILGPLLCIIAYTKKYLQCDWLRGVQYCTLYSVFVLCFQYLYSLTKWEKNVRIP